MLFLSKDNTKSKNPEKGGPEYWHDTQGDIGKDHVMARCTRANQITRHLDILNTIG